MASQSQPYVTTSQGFFFNLSGFSYFSPIPQFLSLGARGMWGAQESHAVLTRALAVLECVWLHLSEPVFPFCTTGTVQVLFLPSAVAVGSAWPASLPTGSRPSGSLGGSRPGQEGTELVSLSVPLWAWPQGEC